MDVTWPPSEDVANNMYFCLRDDRIEFIDPCVEPLKCEENPYGGGYLVGRNK